ncbi:MAG: insulinase family protein, partial [Planctomycetes bacterium]|nr:insulinase family protein [Planctomycetota bacterium]
IAARAGCRYDPNAHQGAASVAAEWLFRGAGDRDTRQLNDAFDALGCQRHESVNSEFLTLSTALLGRNLHEVLSIYADVLRRPQLPDDAFDACRQLVAQDLASLEDEPARKCNMLLRQRFFPDPLGRMTYGNQAGLAAMTPQAIRDHLNGQLSPDGTLLAVAGSIDVDALCDHIESLLGDWTGPAICQPDTQLAPRGETHIEKDSAQMHIALAHDALAIDHEMYYPARVAEAVLAQGMASRLFTEVREKRGLAYHVGAKYVALKSLAGVFVYAGTRPDLAQQTFDVTVGEIQRMAEGVTDEELDRAKAQMRSSLVMEGQSTTDRSRTLASDWYHRGRLRTLEEVSAAIQGVGRDDVMAYLAEHTPRQFTILTIGPQPINTHGLAERR